MPPNEGRRTSFESQGNFDGSKMAVAELRIARY